MSRRWLFACMGVGLAALCALVVMPMSAYDRVFVVYNPTDSLPRGWYRVSSIDNAASLQVGSIVLARLPADVASFAGQRGYLPNGVPILKRIGAVAPQSVCVHEQLVHIDGAVAATARTYDNTHRPLHAWSQCRPLSDGELFFRCTWSLPRSDRLFARELSSMSRDASSNGSTHHDSVGANAVLAD